jgi:hypothetical protein
LNTLDEATLASLAVDAGWNPTPAGSPTPEDTAHPVAPLGSGNVLPLVTPKPSCSDSLVKDVKHLFTPKAPAGEKAQFKNAVFDAMGFESFKLPPPPPKTTSAPADTMSIDPPHDDSDAGGNHAPLDGPLGGSQSEPVGVDIRDDEEQGGDIDGSGDLDDEESGSPQPSKRGRPNKDEDKRVEQLFEEVNKLFDAASVDTGWSISSLIDHWNNQSKYGAKGLPWNSYQHYHWKNIKKERSRAGLLDGTGKL